MVLWFLAVSCLQLLLMLNSLAPGRCGISVESVISGHMFMSTEHSKSNHYFPNTAITIPLPQLTTANLQRHGVLYGKVRHPISVK